MVSGLDISRFPQTDFKTTLVPLNDGLTDPIAVYSLQSRLLSSGELLS